MVDESIFKAYDIRGIYPTQLNEDTAFNIGRAFVSFLKPRNVVVARDCRLSSEKLFGALAKGILRQGADVIDIGALSVNELYFAVSHYKFDSGIMITASHNPKEYNGFKLAKEKAIPLSEETGIQDIKNLILKNNFESPAKKGKIIKKKNVEKDFIDYILKSKEYFDVKKIKPLEVIVDASNGMAGAVVSKLFSKLGIKIVPINFEPDGSFPNHSPDPLKEENKAQIIKKLKEEKEDYFGIIFDGDADRCMFIDENGRSVPGDFMTGLLAKKTLEMNPKATILYDLRASNFVRDIVEKNGGKAVMCRVGHAFIKKYMHDYRALFAGELSGHYYYKIDDSYFENSFIAALQITEMMSSENKTMSQLLELTRNYFISGEMNFEVKDKDKVLEAIEKAFLKMKPEKIYKLDGLSVEFKDWHFNLRKSNTEPLIRLTVEANAKEILDEKVKTLKAMIKKYE